MGKSTGGVCFSCGDLPPYHCRDIWRRGSEKQYAEGNLCYPPCVARKRGESDSYLQAAIHCEREIEPFRSRDIPSLFEEIQAEESGND